MAMMNGVLDHSAICDKIARSSQHLVANKNVFQIRNFRGLAVANKCQRGGIVHAGQPNTLQIPSMGKHFETKLSLI